MILVVSYPDDEHTQDVIERLERQGREVVLIDLADYPGKSTMDFRWTNGKAGYRLGTAKGSIDLSTARVGWWRRVCPFGVDSAVGVGSERAFAESETSQAINGVLDALPCVWVNPREADAAAHHKPLQWAVAQQVGLRLPRTLVTTDPVSAREFIETQLPGKTVFKAFLASAEAWRETRVVEQEDLDRIDLVRYAPVIFQEYIAGVDLRVTVIGESIFAVEIDATETSYPFDMRMVVGEAEIQAVELPAKVSKALLALQRRLKLSYGAIDLRRTPAGEYYFLEVNPAGQWHFAQTRSGLPISQAMADYLAALDSK